MRDASTVSVPAPWLGTAHPPARGVAGRTPRYGPGRAKRRACPLGPGPRREEACAHDRHRPQRRGPRAASQPARARGRQPDRVPARRGPGQALVASASVSPTATTGTVVIARRHNGPPGTANGGYACGLVARHVDGPAHVRLRRPVPLGTPLVLERHGDGHVTLHDGDTLIAEADPALPLDGLEPPYRPAPEEAREAAAARPAALPEAFGTCWVCSPRDDGLGVRFGPLRARPDMTGAVLH